jgi:lycopene beta-cyclase
MTVPGVSGKKENGFFDEIVYKKWEQYLFFKRELFLPHEYRPYQYKMIRGVDFYKFCFDEIGKHTVMWKLFMAM